MNDYRITLTNQAKSDIIDIGDYIAYTLSEPDISLPRSAFSKHFSLYAYYSDTLSVSFYTAP